MMEDEAIRQKHAYLAGLIKGDERQRWKAFYEKEHATHTEKRYAWCPMCEVREIEWMLDFGEFMLREIPKAPH